MLNRYFEDIGQKGLIAEINYLDNTVDFFWAAPVYKSALSYGSVHTIYQEMPVGSYSPYK